MAFETLLNNQMTEPKLVELLISETQKDYSLHQNTYYFFKLNYLGDKISQVIWVKSFDNPKDFADFVYDTKFIRAAMMLKFKNGKYEVLCQGFYFTDYPFVWPHKVSNSSPMEEEPRDRDSLPMPPRELIEGAFGEISEALASSKSNIPV